MFTSRLPSEFILIEWIKAEGKMWKYVFDLDNSFSLAGLNWTSEKNLRVIVSLFFRLEFYFLFIYDFQIVGVERGRKDELRNYTHCRSFSINLEKTA